MGHDKASLMIGNQTFLQHTCGIACQVASFVVVVAGADQAVAEDFSDAVTVIRDPVPFPGPLPALLQGTDALLGQVASNEISHTSVWVTGCDTPFVTSEIISKLATDRLDHNADATTLTQAGQDNPLLAVYSLNALRQLHGFLASQRFRATDFLQSLNVSRLPVEAISRDENTPPATTNLNTPNDFNQAFGFNSKRTNL